MRRPVGACRSTRPRWSCSAATSGRARRATNASTRSSFAAEARRPAQRRFPARAEALGSASHSENTRRSSMASVLSRRTQFVLDESRIPRAWYNIAADLPAPLSPPLHPGTHQPIGPGDLAPLFPMALILQEVSGEREIEIPDPVREAYMLYRPSPLHRAHRLEKALDTPAHIYYKYEGVSPAGSHKPN